MTIQTRIEDWLFKAQAREPAPIRLHRRRIYILPTGHGVTFAVTLLLLFVGSVNYALSLGYVLTFFLAALGIVAMLHTFRNLHGLSFRWRQPEPVFAGEQAIYILQLQHASRYGRYALALTNAAGDRQMVDVAVDAAVPIHAPAPVRGVARPGRIVIETRYPLGLFRAWAKVVPAAHCVVYARPASGHVPWPSTAAEAGQGAANEIGEEEFQFLRAYRPGDSPRRIAWHAFARQRGLLTKQFAQPAGKEIWLDFASAPGRDDEERLSRLTRWLLDAEAAGRAYGLRLPDGEVLPSLGYAHRRRCLERLALYGLDDRLTAA